MYLQQTQEREASRKVKRQVPCTVFPPFCAFRLQHNNAVGIGACLRCTDTSQLEPEPEPELVEELEKEKERK